MPALRKKLNKQIWRRKERRKRDREGCVASDETSNGSDKRDRRRNR